MPTVELHKPGRDPVKVRESVADRWIDAGWSRDDGHNCPHCQKTTKTAGGLTSHIRAKHDPDPAGDGDQQEE